MMSERLKKFLSHKDPTEAMQIIREKFPHHLNEYLGQGVLGMSAMALPPSMSRSLESQPPQDGVITDEASYQAELRRSKMLDGMAAAEIPGVDTHGKDDGCPIDGIITDEASYRAELARSRRLEGLA
ncbi:MAG: hypothetical protein A2W19_11735 [Spirochaetes bacterium RBG_16_49_21]|nr:MAG: hypothetical protein A2W19_11735 [Spirochaetes bacterium RBG_16_49_21]